MEYLQLSVRKELGPFPFRASVLGLLQTSQFQLRPLPAPQVVLSVNRGPGTVSARVHGAVLWILITWTGVFIACALVTGKFIASVDRKWLSEELRSCRENPSVRGKFPTLFLPNWTDGNANVSPEYAIARGNGSKARASHACVGRAKDEMVLRSHCLSTRTMWTVHMP